MLSSGVWEEQAAGARSRTHTRYLTQLYVHLRVFPQQQQLQLQLKNCTVRHLHSIP